MIITGTRPKVIRVHANEIREAGPVDTGCTAAPGSMTMIRLPPRPSCRKKTKKKRSKAPQVLDYRRQ